MELLGFLQWLFSHSLYQLWLPVIRAFGFQTPITFALIVVHNTLAAAYLALLAALAYPVLGQRAWILSSAVAFSWLFVGSLYLSLCGLSDVSLVLAFLPHGWLEFTAIFYWIHGIRGACESLRFKNEGAMLSFSDYFPSFRSPRLLISLVGYDLKSLWNLMGLFFRGLSHSGIKRRFLTVFSLILISALIETYVTPMLIPV